MLVEIERVVRVLNASDVRYLIVGGVAVVLHGYLRTTCDLDLVVQLAPANVTRATQVLEENGYRPRAPVPLEDYADAGKRAQWVRDKHMVDFTVVHPEYPALEIDLFVEEPIDFDAAYERSLEVPVLSQIARVLALNDLIAIKRSSGRSIDLADIEALEHLRDQAGDDHEA